MADIYVVDTHILIWYFIGSRRLPSQLKERIDETRNRGGQLLVPTIVLSEALDIAEKGRVKLDFHRLYQYVQQDEGFEIVGFSPAIFEETRRVTKVTEIHDRVILATARFYKVGVLTKDRIMLESGEMEGPFRPSE